MSWLEPLKRTLARLARTLRPLWLQALLFMLFDLLLYAALNHSTLLISTLLYNGAYDLTSASLISWLDLLLSALVGTVLYAWWAGLNRYITFGPQVQRRWTILPIALWNLGLTLVLGSASLLLMDIRIPLPALNPTIYELLRTAAMLGLFAAFVRMVLHLRQHTTGAIRCLFGMIAAIVLVFVIDQHTLHQTTDVMMSTAFSDEASVARVIYVGEMPDELDSLLPQLGDSVTVIPAGDAASIGSIFPAEADQSVPSTHAASPLLTGALYWLQRAAMFLMLRRWMFSVESPALYSESPEQPCTEA